MRKKINLTKINGLKIYNPTKILVYPVILNVVKIAGNRLVAEKEELNIL